MKKLFTLIFICACLTPLFAQKFSKHQGHGEKHALKVHSAHRGLSNGSANYLKLKSANATKQKLDSVINNYGKDIYRYNAAGQLTYDYSTYSDTANNYEYTNLYKYEYDGQGRLSQIEEYYLDEEGGFKDERSSKTIYTYQDKNNGEIEEYYWNSETEGWELIGKGTLVFDDAGRVVEETGFYQDYSSGELVWESGSRYVTQYHANGKISEETTYVYDPEQQKWSASHKYEYTYDELDNPTQEKSYYWIEGTQMWWINSKYKYETMYQNDQIKESHFLWENEEWVLDYEEIYNLDAEGTPNEVLFNSFLSGGGNGYHTKLTLTHNKQYAYADLLLPQDPVNGDEYYTPLLMHKMLTQSGLYEYDEESKTWDYLAEYTPYYSSVDVVSALEEKTSKSVKVYPNPTKSNIAISGLDGLKNAELQLFTVTGAVVLQQLVNHQTTVTVEHLNPGLYLYQVKVNDEIFTGKVLIDN